MGPCGIRRKAEGHLTQSPIGLAGAERSSAFLTGYSYDLAGNATNDGLYSYQWDAESHLAAAYQSGNLVSLNTYNALGQRVEDVTPTSTTDEAYGAGGNLLLRFTGDSNSG